MNSASSLSSANLSPVLLTPTNAARGAKAAREFETTLIASLLQSLETTFAGLPGEGSLPGSDNYNFLGTQAFAQGIVEHGGFGIAEMISRHLQTSR
jgi:Rod binding domain-containing protein